MKKMLALALVMLMIAACMSACSTKTTTTTTATEAPAATSIPIATQPPVENTEMPAETTTQETTVGNMAATDANTAQ